MKPEHAQRKKAEEPGPTLHDLIAASRLLAIDVVDMEAHREHLSVDRLALPMPQELISQVQVKSLHRPEMGAEGATFLAGVEITWTDKASGLSLARGAVMLRLAYAFNPMPEGATAVTIAAFSREVAMHHAWPFLRERVDALCRAIGLPPFVLPIKHLNAGVLPVPNS